MKQPAVYIMASRRNGTIYTGVTSDLVRASQCWQHREGKSASQRAMVASCWIWFELHEEMLPAIAREKQIKRRLSKAQAGPDRSNEFGLGRSLGDHWPLTTTAQIGSSIAVTCPSDTQLRRHQIDAPYYDCEF